VALTESLENDKPFLITLQDVDGKVVGSTTYKVANSAKLYMVAKTYPKISFVSNLDSSVKPATLLQTTDTYRDRLGDNSYSGYGRPRVTIEGYIPLIINTDTQAHYFDAVTYNSNSIIPLNFYLLFNLHLLNHRVYLKDINPAKQSSCTNWSTPINILMNRTDIFGNIIFDSTKGMPVLVKEFTMGDIIYEKNDPNKEMLQSIKIVLELD